MIRLLTLAGLVLLLVGCGARETAKSAEQADQAVRAAQQRLAGPELLAILTDPAMPPELADRLAAHLDPSLDLLFAARTALAPVRALLGRGLPIQTDTTAEEAAADPEAFTRKVHRQAVLAEVEVQQALWWQQIGDVALEYAGAIGGSWVSKLLLVLGGGGAAAGAATAIARTVGTIRRLHGDLTLAKEAVFDAVKAGDAFAAAPDDAAVAAAKEDQAKIQEARGTAAPIREALARARAERKKAQQAAQAATTAAT